MYKLFLPAILLFTSLAQANFCHELYSNPMEMVALNFSNSIIPGTYHTCASAKECIPFIGNISQIPNTLYVAIDLLLPVNFTCKNEINRFRYRFLNAPRFKNDICASIYVNGAVMVGMFENFTEIASTSSFCFDSLTCNSLLCKLAGSPNVFWVGINISIPKNFYLLYMLHLSTSQHLK